MRNVGGRPPARFCKWGHDTHDVGRDTHGACKTCRRISDKRRSVERHKKRYVPKPKPPKYDSEWVQARVSRWLEIAAEDPIPTHNGAVNRLREFNLRYQRLEADVPTPGLGARV